MAVYVVTGGAGFIGSNIVERLVEAGEEVRVVDNMATGHRENLDCVGDAARLFEGSICDADLLREAFDGADYVLHQGALASVPRSVADPVATNHVNVAGTLQVLEAARACGVKRVVYASSSSVYGDVPTLPKREDMTPAAEEPLRRQQAGRRALLPGLQQRVRPGDGRAALLQRLRPAPGPGQPVRGRHPDLHPLHLRGRGPAGARRRRAVARLHLRGRRRGGQHPGGEGRGRRGRRLQPGPRRAPHAQQAARPCCRTSSASASRPTTAPTAPVT